jgi:hypothetical protein
MECASGGTSGVKQGRRAPERPMGSVAGASVPVRIRDVVVQCVLADTNGFNELDCRVRVVMELD